jgi:hypothetical protein
MIRISFLPHVMADLHVLNPQISPAKVFLDEVLGNIFLLLSGLSPVMDFSESVLYLNHFQLCQSKVSQGYTRLYTKSSRCSRSAIRSAPPYVAQRSRYAK